MTKSVQSLQVKKHLIVISMKDSNKSIIYFIIRSDKPVVQITFLTVVLHLNWSLLFIITTIDIMFA